MPFHKELVSKKHSAKNGHSSLVKTARFTNSLTFLWLFGGGHIFLFFARTKGLWFEGFYGFFLGLLLSLSVILLFLSKRSFTLKWGALAVFSLLFFVISLSVIFSSKIQSGDRHALTTTMMLIPFVFLPGFWGLLFPEKIQISEKMIFRWCFLLLFLGNIYVFSHYLADAHTWLRFGVEANTIALSFAFANFWIIFLTMMIHHGKTTFFIFFSMVAFFNVMIFSTRQSLVYLALAILYLGFRFLNPFKLNTGEQLKMILSKRRAKLVIAALICLFVIVPTVYFITPVFEDNEVIRNAFSTALRRWNLFFESGFAGSARARLFWEGAAVWQENTIFGEFAYEDPGSYAHHLIVDFFAQYGLVGGITYLSLIMLALYRAINSPKEKVLSLAFFAMFLGLLFLGMTVTRVTLNPVFHFLLFYWLSTSSKRTKLMIHSKNDTLLQM